jgi:RNA recognition motif-containing protein
MTYHPTNGHNDRMIYVILSSQESVSRAVSELNGAPLFDRDVTISPFVRKGVKASREVERNHFELRWGWYASKSARLSQIKQRPPLLEHPTNIFAPIREGRSVVFDNIPAPARATRESDLLFYELLHAFSVVSMSMYRKYKPTKSELFSGFLRTATFKTNEDAQLVCQLYDGHTMQGREIVVGISKPPMKHLAVAWDGGRPGAHSTLRDQGSAVGTNLEKVRIESELQWT